MTRKRLRLASTVAVLVVAAIVMWRMFMPDSMTLDEANSQVDAEINAALALLPKTVTITKTIDFSASPCRPDKDWPQKAERKILVTRVVPADNQKIRAAIKQSWLDRGYEIRSEDDHGFQVDHPDTLMSLDLTSYHDDRLSITANSPCVGPHGRNYG